MIAKLNIGKSYIFQHEIFFGSNAFSQKLNICGFHCKPLYITFIIRWHSDSWFS